MNIAKSLSYLLPNAEWSLTNNDYSTLEWLSAEPKPSMEELEAAWVELQQIKTWPNVQAFMAEFTMQEKAAIALSSDATIAALRLELTTWFSQVLSNDQRVQMGLDKLVELGIITEQRKQEIININ